MSDFFNSRIDISLMWIFIGICVYIYNGLKFRGVDPYKPIEVVFYAIYVIFIGIIYTFFRLSL